MDGQQINFYFMIFIYIKKINTFKCVFSNNNVILNAFFSIHKKLKFIHNKLFIFIINIIFINKVIEFKN